MEIRNRRRKEFESPTSDTSEFLTRRQLDDERDDRVRGEKIPVISRKIAVHENKQVRKQS